MKITIIVFTVFIFYLLNPSFAQETVTVSGYVSDAATGERLSGATVYIPASGKGTACNSFGFFSITVFPGQKEIVFRFVGYEPQVLSLTVEKDEVLDIQLKTNNNLDEVEVKASPRENFLLSPSFGIHRLNAQEIEKIPSVLGEPDLLKAIQLLPGVSFATEGATSFSVRGGSPDQTLILLDGVPVYNVNHLFGFMSAFNNDAIKESELFKGSLPARFGGRLSSVLDVSMKEGNMKKHSGTFSLSPMAGRYTLEGPILKDKISYMISGRRFWLDGLWLAFQGIFASKGQLLSYGFWDINGKTNWIVNQNNRVYLSFYTGRDNFWIIDNLSDYYKFSLNWQNMTSVLRWNHIFSPKMFANFSAYNSRFRQAYLNKFNKEGTDKYVGYNNLNDWSLKGDFDWIRSTDARFNFGYQLSSKKFSPEIISTTTDSTSFTLNKDIFTTNVISEIYAEGELTLSEKLKGSFGLRGGNMFTEGKSYWSVRPRVSFRYLFSEKISGKIAYSRMAQYLHQLQNTTLGIPTELWVSSTKTIRPGNSDLYSAGLFFKPVEKYNLSAEAFYTGLKKVVRYKEGITYTKERGDSWEDYVAVGKGKSYGVELMVEKTAGNFTGWIAYTLSKSTRQFDEINFGEEFPFDYDRRHQININSNYNFRRREKKGKQIRRNLSATFNFASGKYMTLAEQEYQGIALPLMENSVYRSEWYSSRSYVNSVNNYQMPDFHNLNLSYRIERKSADKTIVWNFSVYNVYNRLNPWYYYKKDDQMKQITLFPIIPSISYTYKW